MESADRVERVKVAATRRRSVVLVAALHALLSAPVGAMQTGEKEKPPNSSASQEEALGDRFRFYRWLEDYSDLSDAERRDHPIGRLKRLRFGRGVYPNLSFGGEYRLRYEHNSNRFFGIVSPDSTDSFLHRLLVHSDLRISDRARAFVQLSRYEEHGNDLGPGPFDDSRLDVQLAFVDYQIQRTGWRVGRQELALGSGKFTAVREGANQRRAFDAVRFTVAGEAGLALDVFYGEEVQPKVGAFDDDTGEAPALWGVYGSKVVRLGELFLDTYYLGLSRDNARFDQGAAQEERHTVGARIAGGAENWSIDTEVAYQFGRFGVDDIDAFGARSDIYYQSGLPGRPKLGLRLAVTSGDRDPNDGRLGTFSALFPNLNYNSESAIYGPGNGYEIHPNIELKPTEELAVRVGVDFLWRESKYDAVYSGPGLPLVAGSSSDSRYVGSLLNVEAGWTPTPRVTLSAAYTHAKAGSFIRQGGGKDTNFAMISVATRF